MSRKGPRPARDWRTEALLRAIEAGALDRLCAEQAIKIEEIWVKRLGSSAIQECQREFQEKVSAYARELTGMGLAKDSPARVAHWAYNDWWQRRHFERSMSPFSGRLRWRS